MDDNVPPIGFQQVSELHNRRVLGDTAVKKTGGTDNHTFGNSQLW